MIEARIDFNELQQENIPDTDWDGYLPKEIDKKMYGWLSEKLNLPVCYVPDAFQDYYWFLNFKEWGEFEDEPAGEWESREEFLRCKKENSTCGLKNENGVRDDLKLIFVNFNKFRSEYPEFANILLKVIRETREEILSYNDEDDEELLKIEVVIES